MSEGGGGSAVSFGKVKEAEREWINTSRGLRGGLEGDPLVGLAFSGGGIRSATFNLGILQGLAKKNILRKIDYLSTVSGGGYIGSWLQAWIQRSGNGLDGVEEGLKHEDKKEEAREIHWLRDYSNYLTPRTGLFSADTWTMVAVYLRNLLLNLTVLILALTAVLLLPRIVLWATMQHTGAASPWMSPSFAATLVFLFIAVVFVGLNMREFSVTGEPRWYRRQWGIQVSIVFPTVVAACAASVWLHHYGALLMLGARWIAAGTAMYVVCWSLAALLIRKGGGLPGWKVLVLASIPAGAVGGLGLWGMTIIFEKWTAPDLAVAAFGVPLLLLVFKMTAAFHIGLMGTKFTDPYREWWARVGGWVFLYSLGWLGLFGIALYGSFLVLLVRQGIHEWANSGAALAWLVTTVSGVWAGKSAATGGREENLWAELLAKLSPYVFIAGLLIVVSHGVQLLLLRFQDKSYPSGTGVESLAGLLRLHWEAGIYPTLDGHWWILLFVSVAAVSLLVWWLSCKVDINEFSMHLFYRVRLARCYLGASVKDRWKKKQPFTGFSREDDVLLSKIDSKHGGPYPIVNTALNLTKGEELAWQQRKAASFVFTPEYCGFTLPEHAHREEDEEKRDCYRPTKSYAYENGGPYLGTAVGISGAAASPNMGYHSTPALAFLLTVFNVRMGWWSGNPTDPNTWKTPGPSLGLKYLLKELFADTSLDTPYLYLSDGGHFENLGIYELVRRKCKVIIACDSGADPKFVFGDLGSAIEKCRVDLGVNIKINVNHLKPVEEMDEERQKVRDKLHYALGVIQYGKELEDWGWLVYIKSSMTNDEPADVLNYKAEQDKFPHEPTADQWFDERQFESYRALGEHIAKRVFREKETDEMVLRWVAKPLFEKEEAISDNIGMWGNIQEYLGLPDPPKTQKAT